MNLPPDASHPRVTDRAFARLAEIAALDPAGTALFTEKGTGHGLAREAARHERRQPLSLPRAGALPIHHLARVLPAADIGDWTYDSSMWRLVLEAPTAGRTATPREDP